jgi:hypothetical protein
MAFLSILSQLLSEWQAREVRRHRPLSLTCRR